MRTVKVREKDFEEYEYSLKVICPYCGNSFFFYEYQKWIDKTDYCPKCGKDIHVKSEEVKL